MDAELAEIRDFLAEHPPYDTLPSAVLSRLPGQMKVRYVRRGTPVLRLGSANDTVSIVRSGALDIHDGSGRLVERADVGTTIGNSNVIHGGPVQYDVTALEDTLLLDLPGRDFLQLVTEHAPFGQFFVQLLAARIRGAVEAVQVAEGGGAILKTRVRDMIRRAPVTTPATATIREAATTMSTQNVSAVLVMDGPRMVGIVTDRDLRNRVVAVGRDLSEPVSAIMSSQPVTASADALAFEVLLDVIGRNVHHLPVLDGDTPIGLVTSTDLVRLERGNPIYLAGEIASMPDLTGLVEASARLPHIVEQLVSQDATADDIGRIVTAVGDAITRRLIELTIAKLGPPPSAYCWVVLGSQARGEQALAADQDHALILSDDVTPEGAAYFEALAASVADGLEACGYPRCTGDVMATNPRWRQSVSGWRAEFARWVEKPEPDAILHASVFFDMRPVHGDGALYRPLEQYIGHAAPHGRLFLAQLAKAAVAHTPPLGFFRGFVLQHEGEHRDTLDLKWGGVGAVVELARVLALSGGSSAVSTQSRLRAAGSSGQLTEQRAADVSDAFEFISYVRLRHQARQVREGRTPDNFVPPTELSSFERRHLRDAFAIVRGTQQILTQVHPLQYMS
jgi:CBS domain-containing protein